ncbi:hypothetical protein [Schlesneria paludicola]|uniref:hypothetical protein n=1 Tax=Schlesneria paludicola TaxID=360056 RepID=UPI00029AAC46|nr:hypothetical protein [Schlesneria paludicola]
MKAIIAEIAVMLVAFTRLAGAQELTSTGMLATGTMSRSKIVADDFQLGDLMYVKVRQPAGIGDIYVSVHLYYSDDTQGDNSQDAFVPVRPSNDALGEAYTSAHDGGVRDFVKFSATNESTIRHVSLFIPYKAASLPLGRQFRRRYAIILWDRTNTRVSTKWLKPELVEANPDASGTVIITTVSFSAPCALPESGPLVPTPQSTDHGKLQFFNSSSGDWICPVAN